MIDNDPISANRRSWDKANRQFNVIKGDFAESIVNGYCAIPGAILRGLDIGPATNVLHLCCNDGTEACYLSFSKNCKVTGVDFSSSAIEFAQELSTKLNLDSEFVHAEVMEYLTSVESLQDIDLIFLSMGTLKWILNIDAFFEAIRRKVSKRCSILVWDFHPLLECFNQEGIYCYDYPIFDNGYWRDQGVYGYKINAESYEMPARRKFENPPKNYINDRPVYISCWSLGKLFSSALDNGFCVSSFEEMNFLFGEKYRDWMIETEPGVFSHKSDNPVIPMSMKIVLSVKC